jgi:hypothetical protein
MSKAEGQRKAAFGCGDTRNAEKLIRGRSRSGSVDCAMRFDRRERNERGGKFSGL